MFHKPKLFNPKLLKFQFNCTVNNINTKVTNKKTKKHSDVILNFRRNKFNVKLNFLLNKQLKTT